MGTSLAYLLVTVGCSRMLLILFQEPDSLSLHCIGHRGLCSQGCAADGKSECWVLSVRSYMQGSNLYPTMVSLYIHLISFLYAGSYTELLVIVFHY